MNADFEGIEVHSRKVFNIVKEKTTTTKQADESVGPMVNSKIAEANITKNKTQKNQVSPGLFCFFLFCLLF